MRKLLVYILSAVLLTIVVACSPSKNTALSRRVQALKTCYNTYYNGHMAYKDGLKAQEEGNKDNYTEPLTVYASTNKATMKVGSGNYATAIEKCQKAIKLHSITKRPKWTKKRRKTEKDKIWLSQKEYNPFAHKAWLLLGEAQFKRGDYMESASTFSYIQTQFFHKPDVVAKAKVLEARAYSAMEWYFEAEDLIYRAQRDSFPTNMHSLKSRVLADVQVRQKMYAEAIPNLLKAVKSAESSYDKSRMYFLLAQLYHKTGNDVLALKYYKKVIRRNPPYEMEFNARIQMTEAMSKGRSKSMIRMLKGMARNPKNANYLDQVYYAIGNIYLAEGDTTRAIWAYNDGVEKATRTGIEKGVLLVHLGQLYYDTEKFVKAQECYSQALGLFDKDHEDYHDIDERTKVLEELLPSAQAVELQDSLQELARMDSVTRMKVIAKIIEEVKKKEKEEQRKQTEAAVAAQNNRNNGARPNMPGANNAQQTAGLFYFYNERAVTSGKAEFQSKWGQRELADDWNRKNKTVLADFNDDNGDEDAEDEALASDSLAMDSLAMDSLGNPVQRPDAIADGGKANGGSDASKDGKKDGKKSKEEKQREKEEEYMNDPHRPEYYLKDIPFTEEQMAASNQALVTGLYGSGIIFKDRMDNMPLAERTFNRIMTDFPEFDKMDDVYYNLYQLYSRYDRRDEAEACKMKLIEEFPDNEHGKMIADPNYEFKARYGKAIEDSLYTVSYDAFKEGQYDEVLKNNEYAAAEYPDGDNRPRFMFITAMSQLELGQHKDFSNSLKEIVEKYPKSTVSELAGLYVKGLKEGRVLASGKFEMGNAWERRFSIASDDSTAVDTTFSDERNADWLFAIAYERDSISENQLLFEMAKYNFMNFTVRNFDLSFQKGEGIDMLQVRQFANYDEAYIYLHRLSNNAEMTAKLQGLKMFIISEDNLKKLMRGLSFADYFDFYDENFDRMGHLEINEDLLDEPTELPEPREEGDEYDDENEYEDDFY